MLRKIALAVCALLFATGGATTQSAHSEKMKNVDLSPYKQEQWPEVYAKYGAKRVRGELQMLRREGAEAAAEFPECDEVAWSEYAPSRSTSSTIVVYADCMSGFRIYYSHNRVIEKQQHSRLDGK